VVLKTDSSQKPAGKKKLALEGRDPRAGGHIKAMGREGEVLSARNRHAAEEGGGNGPETAPSQERTKAFHRRPRESAKEREMGTRFNQQKSQGNSAQVHKRGLKRNERPPGNTKRDLIAYQKIKKE